MKKNIQINLCGRLYQIDEDAYQLLSHYTETLRNYFMKQEGGSEIADDIEQRIAELFDELVASGTQAITIENVQNIINQIGDLKDITENDEQTSKEKNSTYQQTQKATHLHEMLNKKKFYRDTTNNVLFGVLAGASHYMGTGRNTLRWLFVLLCIGWGFLATVFPTILTTFFLGPISLVFIPLAIVPEIIYFVLGLCIPPANTPEESLKMRGVPVTPQNLTSEVKQQSVQYTKKSNISGWNIFTGTMSIIIAICSSINLIGCLITASILFTVLAREVPEFLDGDVILSWTKERTTFFIYLLIACVSMILSVGIVLYCSIHSALSSFKKAKPMSNLQRILWAIGWVATLTLSIVFIILSTTQFKRLEEMESDAHQARNEVWQKEHTREDGFYHSDEEWEFLQAGRWNVLIADDVDDNRVTYTGDYYINNDYNTRYLDVYCDGTPARVLIQRADSLEPGTYRLTAAVKANNDHKFVFALGEDDQYRLAEIPVYDDEGGLIHEVACKMQCDTIDIDITRPEEALAFELLKSKSPHTLKKIAEANYDQGNGWSYVAINDIVVTKPTYITYGITTDRAITGVEPTTGWFSATDFKIEKIK